MQQLTYRRTLDQCQRALPAWRTLDQWRAARPPRSMDAGSTGRALAYYLKKSVEIPKREFFYLTDEELNQITKEVADEIL